MNLVGPKGDSSPNAQVKAGTGTGYSAIETGTSPVVSLIFDGLGQPVSAARVALIGNTTIDITNAARITIEAITGYVHD